ncbi:glycoprotein-N-acetylgalactosamine 3-beta-galactosyltransferase 1-like [Glandiceps talaboti]
MNPAASVRILCFVTTSPTTAPIRLQAVKDTWSKRCDKMLYFSSVEDRNQSIIGLNVTEGYEELWGKTKAAFKYIYRYHLDDADWFLKADDDTYIVVDNLRRMLEQYDSSEPVYFGHRFHLPKTNQSYMSGGGGYVISKAGLKKLAKKGLYNRKLCRAGEKGYEDVLMGECLERIEVVHGDSRDEFGKNRFLPIPLDTYFRDNVPNWLYQYDYYPILSGKDCCSDSLISAHHIAPFNMYLLEYLIYKVSPLETTNPDSGS